MLNHALKDLEKAQKEYSKASETYKAASTAAREAWNKIQPGDLRTLGKDHPTYIEAMEASRKEKEASKAENLTRAVLYAASTNAAYTAANVLLDAFKAAPEKFNKPVHYKVFKETCQQIIGDQFYISESWGSLYLYFRGASGGEKEIFLADLKNGCIEYNQHTENRRPVLTLGEIKKEAKKAVKDAEKLHKLEEKLYQESEKIQGSYKSYIKHMLPYASKYNLTDNYKLF